MIILDVDTGPSWDAYDTAGEAIDAFLSHPKQDRAKSDYLELAGSTLVSGVFGVSKCILSFSNGKHLVIEACEYDVTWKIAKGELEEVHLVKPVRLNFGSDIEVDFDPNPLISSIIGSEVVRLAVTGRNFLVYTKGNDIFWLSAYRLTLTDSDLLHVYFQD